MGTLSEMFELELPTVHSIISKMIINEELMVNTHTHTPDVIPLLFRPHTYTHALAKAGERIGLLLWCCYKVKSSLAVKSFGTS